MKKTLSLLPLAGLLFLGACGDDDGGSSGGRQEIVDFLIDEGETPEAAECYADELSDYSIDDFESVAAAESEDDIDADFALDIVAASEACADL